MLIILLAVLLLLSWAARRPVLTAETRAASRAGAGSPARIVASWKNLKSGTYDKGQQKKREVLADRYACANTAAFAVRVSSQSEQAIRV
jgi:hypothetical protein